MSDSAPTRIAPLQRRSHGSELSLLGLLAAGLFLACLTTMRDMDIWWHLKTGELILQRGAVPSVDWYTFTDSERPWVDLHWGFQLLVYGLHKLGGVPALTLLKATVLTAAFAVAWFTAERTLPAWLKSIVWFPALICIIGRAHERPEMFSVLFLAASLWIVSRVHESPTSLWWFVPMMVLWVNMHSLFVLGAVVGVAYAIDQMCRRAVAGATHRSRSPDPGSIPSRPVHEYRTRFGLSPADGPPISSVLIVGFCAAAACLVNPYFEEGALFPLETYRKLSLDHAFYSRTIGEFMSPIQYLGMTGVSGLSNPFLCAACVVAALWILSTLLLVSQRRVSVLRLLLLIGYGQLGLVAVRNANVFALVGGVVTCWNAAEFLAVRSHRRQKGRVWPAHFGGTLTEEESAAFRNMVESAASTGFETAESMKAVLRPSTIRVNWIAATLIGLWVLSIPTNLWARFLGRVAGEDRPFQLGEPEAWAPHEACRFAGQPGFPKHCIAVHIGLAATYEFHNGPERRTLMDPRLEVCSRDTFLLYYRITGQFSPDGSAWDADLLGPKPPWNPMWAEPLRAAIGEYPVVIIDSRGSRGELAGMLNMPTWRLVYADASAGVFLHRTDAERLNLPEADFSPLKYPPMGRFVKQNKPPE